MKPLKAWCIENWNPGDLVYVAKEPARVNDTIFVMPCWFDAREAARSFFGRDIPNHASWILVKRKTIAPGSLIVSHTLNGIRMEEVCVVEIDCQYMIDKIARGESFEIR